MNIVFASSEAHPFIKTGGLGDVMEALPNALSKIKDNQIYLFLPYYSKIKNNSELKIEHVDSFYIDLSWRRQYVGLYKYKSKKRKLKIYFIDNEQYFFRASEYGEYDDGERFAYFSKAILESLTKLGLKPDIIHCNDWQTALIPLFLHKFYHESLGMAKTVFTIHNIEYQGKCDPFFLGDTLGLDDSAKNTLSFNGNINLVKGAILSADCITTVSKTYAEEIKTDYHSHGLAGIINDHSFKLRGIVNGIDTEQYSPITDKALFANYDAKSVGDGKKKNKKQLQKLLGLEVKNDVIMMGMVSRIVHHKGIDIICRYIDELMKREIELVILGTGDAYYENILKEKAKKYQGRFSLNLNFDLKLASQIYAASDIYLMPSISEPCGLSQLIAMRYGTVPVVSKIGGLNDTVKHFCDNNDGTGFVFDRCDDSAFIKTIDECIDVFKNNQAQKDRLIENAMNYDSSWNLPAIEYMELYNGLLDNI